MSLLEDLTKDTDDIVHAAWKRRDGNVVPEPDDLGLSNEAVDLEATFLYADLADSTELATHNQTIAAEVFKVYLRGATKIIRSMGGEIRSFDGDRVMGVFTEGAKNTCAVEAALKINYFFKNVLKPAFGKFYGEGSLPGGLQLTQSVGIDTSKVMTVRSGIRNNNDLVWVGRAPNVAAKLSAIREGYSTYITATVFNVMLDTSKYGGNPKQLMWEARSWGAGKPFGTESIYRSNWWWKPS